MNLMSLKDNYFLVVFAAFMVCATATTLRAQQTDFDKLKERFESGEIFNAQFEHQSIDSYTQDTTFSKGTIWVGKDKYKVRTQNQSVVIDGETSMVFDDNRNRVLLSDYVPEEDDFAPSRILNGVDSTYVIESHERLENVTIITMGTDDPFAVFKEVEITLNGNHMPLRIFAIDQSDNLITTTFEDGSFIDQQPEMFHLDYPEGAEIVDMRN